MKCPHCLVDIHPKIEEGGLGYDADYRFKYKKYDCSKCGKASFELELGNKLDGHVIKTHLVYPKGVNRDPCPIEVPDKLREDYYEACLVLPDSPKASAALSRR